MGPRLAGSGTVILVVAAALGVWWLTGPDGSTTDDPSHPHASTSSAHVSDRVAPSEVIDGTDPSSGLPFVELSSLPPEAVDTVHLIDSGGPFPYDEDGSTFGNYEGLLPDEPSGYYKEYTVETPGSPDRGARRIISGGDGRLYWTADHYASFEVIRRATP